MNPPEVCGFGLCFRNSSATVAVRVEAPRINEPTNSVSFTTEEKFLPQEAMLSATALSSDPTIRQITTDSVLGLVIYFVSPEYASWATRRPPKERRQTGRDLIEMPAWIVFAPHRYSPGVWARYITELEEREKMASGADPLIVDIARDLDGPKFSTLIKTKGLVFFCAVPGEVNCEATYGGCGRIEYRISVPRSRVSEWPEILDNSHKRVIRALTCSTTKK